jgi:hypothetical protein
MYRYIVDNVITYTQDDLALFRESPFALWMERLTLENPDHGIPADTENVTSANRSDTQEDIVATLRSEGRNVALIDWELDEPERRTATLEAMRDGADFIVNGQLAVDCLSGVASLLMRTSGYSELGDFLYMPCETNARNTLQSAFRLSFVADLLLNVQGQLPPQMLIIRGGAEVVPLQVEDYIYYYRAVQRRFLQAMQSFRKHRMPDPAESSHFGRWAECASEVLKQRALSEQQRTEAPASAAAASAAQASENETAVFIELPQLRVAGGSGMPPRFDNEAPAANGKTTSPTVQDSNATLVAQTSHIHTLAEQARLLAPGSFGFGKPPGRTPNLARYTRPRPVADAPNMPVFHNRRSSDAALENLEFIGSSPSKMVVDMAAPLATVDESARQAPASNLRDTVKREVAQPVEDVKPAVRLPELEPRTPVFLPPNGLRDVPPPVERLRPRVSTADSMHVTRSVIDLDNAPSPALAPVVQRAEAELGRLVREDPMFRNVNPNWPHSELQNEPQGGSRTHSPEETGAKSTLRLNPFSDSLITGDEFSDS